MEYSEIIKEVNSFIGYSKLNFLCNLFIELGVKYEGGICEDESDFVEIFISEKITDDMTYYYLLNYTNFYNLKKSDNIFSFFNKDTKSGILQQNLLYDNMFQRHEKKREHLISDLKDGHIKYYNTLLDYSEGKEIKHDTIKGIRPFQSGYFKFTKYDFSSFETNVKLFKYFTENKKFLNSITEEDYLSYYSEFVFPEREYEYLLHTMELPDIMKLILYSNPENDEKIRQQIKDFFEYNKWLVEIIKTINNK